jgi:polyferredoxin
MAIEILLAAMISALALMALPRKSVRRRLAASRQTVRFQYMALFLVPTWLLAILLWADIWRRVVVRGSGAQFQSALILGGVVWGLLLAFTVLPDIWRGRSPAQKVPTYWLWGDPLYRGGIRAVPSIMVALLIVALSAAVIPLNQRGIVGDWIFFTLFIAAIVALIMALSVIMFNWPTFLVPPSMRGQRGAIQESLDAQSQPRPPSNNTP